MSDEQYIGTVSGMSEIVRKSICPNGLTPYGMMGLDYDDSKWDELLDQLTFDEMVTMIVDSIHCRMPVETV